MTTDEFSRNLNGFSLAENLLQKALLTVMLLHRPANAEMEDESWKHSFHVDSLIHFAGDLFILDINWPILPPAFVWEAVENTKINIHLQFIEVILCSDHIKQVKKLVLQVGKHNAQVKMFYLLFLIEVVSVRRRHCCVRQFILFKL